MADSVTVKVSGIDELKRALTTLPSKLRRKVLTKALRAGAKVVQKAARAAAPVLASPTAYRTRGLLKRRLSVRVSKESKSQGNVGVFVNVKPAAKGQRGAKNPLDPYYWRFVAFGTKAHTIKPKTAKGLAFGGRVVKMVKHPGSKGSNFLEAGGNALPQALAAFEREAIPAIEALNTRSA
jgi:HK97 gp10 family phage protein